MSNDTIRGGAHGTSVTRANKIQKLGFKPSSGVLGTGVYFWKNGPYSRYLAWSWWKYKSSEQRYKFDSDRRCCTIEAVFDINEQEFLDLEDKDIKEAFATLCFEKKLTRSSHRRECAAILNSFIQRLEDKLGIVFKVMESSVTTPPPKFCDGYPLSSLGAPRCYIVFDSACVRITNVMMC